MFVYWECNCDILNIPNEHRLVVLILTHHKKNEVADEYEYESIRYSQKKKRDVDIATVPLDGR